MSNSEKPNSGRESERLLGILENQFNPWEKTSLTVYIPPDIYTTSEQQAQFEAGLFNQAMMLTKLDMSGGDKTHYYQGMLSWASHFDHLDIVRDLLNNKGNVHQGLSLSYFDNNALYNAVIGGAKDTKLHLLGAGADPVQMLETHQKVMKGTDLRAKRMRYFASKHTRSQHVVAAYKWVPPEA